MQILTISGNIGSDAVLRSTSGGDKVLGFNVGVRQGFKQDAPTVWYRCSVWGKRAESLDGRLFKGVKVFVAGDLTIGEYQGKTQYDVRVSEVDFVPRGDARREPDGSQGHGGQSFDDELDSDVPFMRWGDR